MKAPLSLGTGNVFGAKISSDREREKYDSFISNAFPFVKTNEEMNIEVRLFFQLTNCPFSVSLNVHSVFVCLFVCVMQGNAKDASQK